VTTLNKYRIWCDTDSKWEYQWADESDAVPTACPTDTGHSVDTAKTSVVEVQGKDPKLGADNILLTSPKLGAGSEKYFYTPNMCDRLSWYHNSTVVTEFAMTDSGDQLTYNTNSTHINWIDMQHGRVFQEKKIVATTPTLALKVEVSTDAGATWDEKVLDTDYNCDYAAGTVTFLSALGGGDLVRASFHKENGYLFTMVPAAGKVLQVQYVEVQVSKDASMTCPCKFSVWAYNPQDPPNKIEYEFEFYETMWDFLQESTGPFPVMPDFGGSSAIAGSPGRVRGLGSDVITIPFSYLARRDLATSTGAEIRVEISEPWGGTFANATLYCLSEDE